MKKASKAVKKKTVKKKTTAKKPPAKKAPLLPPAEMLVKLSQIRTDGGTQSRVQLDNQAVCEYAGMMKAGVKFPAIHAFVEGKFYWLADGFHRYEAAKLAGRKTILVSSCPGTKRDAILFSVGANATNGVRRTNADKRRAATMLLEDTEWSTMSDRAIAEQCVVSNNLVSTIRRELCVNDSSKTPVATKGMDGKTRKRKPTKAKPVKSKKEPVVVSATQQDVEVVTPRCVELPDIPEQPQQTVDEPSADSFSAAIGHLDEAAIEMSSHQRGWQPKQRAEISRALQHMLDGVNAIKD